MSRPIVLRDEALMEFDQAFDWYDQAGREVGMKFLAAVQRTFDLISAKPDLHPAVHGDIRKTVVRRFPYCIFYRTHADRIEIIAVFHTSRDPSIWQRRA